MDLLIKFVKMYPLIQLLRSELVAIIKRIDNGNCDISDVDDMNEVITVLHKTTHRDKPMSKYDDNDRCHYYHGEWNTGDLTRGCIAVAVGVALRYILTRVLIN